MNHLLRYRDTEIEKIEKVSTKLNNNINDFYLLIILAFQPF